ncbi:hypothetical protein R1flu_008659 [Riccia fluitans]|uniref:Uncharacterized protein n=1 Tax=Riccia fluitans TaxID=41844 RepID=A0ABD1YDD0_9MARC
MAATAHRALARSPAHPAHKAVARRAPCPTAVAAMPYGRPPHKVIIPVLFLQQAFNIRVPTGYGGIVVV